MRKSIFIIFLIGIVSLPIIAQQNSSPQNSQVTIRVAYGQEALSVDDDPAVGFDTAIINPTCTDCPINVLRATLATCVNIGDTVWIRSDGENAVVSEGLPIVSNAAFSVFGYENIANFSAISGMADSSTLHCQFSRIP